MKILNFGQLSLAPESEKLPLHYVVMDSLSIKHVGIIPPSDYTIERIGSWGGEIYINPNHKLKKNVGWTTYSKVLVRSMGLNTLYLGISKNVVFDEIKSELRYIDEGILNELKDSRSKHNKIKKSFKIMEEHGCK